DIHISLHRTKMCTAQRELPHLYVLPSRPEPPILGSAVPAVHFQSLSTNSTRGELSMQLTAIFEKVPKGYIGFVEEVPGTRTRGRTLEEVREKLADAVEHVLEVNRARAEKTLKGKQVIRESMPLPSGMKRAELLQHLKRYT